MVRIKHISSAFIIFMVLCALIGPVNAVSDNGPDKQTYIVVFKESSKDKKTDA